MVTGVTTTNMMQSNVIGTTSNAMSQHKEVMPVKSDRRSNKPIMEKRRRARINNCLNELKTLILDATKKDPARHSKLEKADILEKTVKYLQELQRKQAVMQQASDPKVLNKFKAGFADCANEVSRFPGLDPATKRRLLQHLSNCLNGVKTELHQHQRHTIAAAQMHTTQILPSPPSSPEQQDHLPIQHQHHQQQQQQQTSSTTTNPYAIQQTAAGYFLPNGLQVIPTKLPNGSIALVLPQQQTTVQSHHHQQQQQQQHQQQQQQHQQVAMLTKLQSHSMLVPIPMRTASTSSASSHASSSCGGYDCNMPLTTADAVISNSYTPPSPANSYEAMEYKPTVIQHAATAAAAAFFQADQQQQQQQRNQQQQQYHSQPLSLVVRKDIVKEEEQPWRPW